MRILIAHDSDIVRRGIVSLLAAETNWNVSGEARNGLETLQKAQKLQPDQFSLMSAYRFKWVGGSTSPAAGSTEGEDPRDLANLIRFNCCPASWRPAEIVAWTRVVSPQTWW
jgi:DNA-binding NarL/FixJ family response regulator